MKARDIIPGWPRGRSTLRDILYDSFHIDYNIDGIAVFRIEYEHRCLFTKNEELKQAKLQFTFEKTYHKMQQAMVNEWFARYRLGDIVFRKQACPNLVTEEQAKELEKKGHVVWRY